MWGARRRQASWVADPGCGEDYAVGDEDRPFGQDAHRPDALPAIDRTASDDGVTVSDRVTGLVWQRCALGQIYDAASDDCVAPVARQTHAGAVAYCEALDLAGRSWRLPSARELATLPDYGFAQPTLDTTSGTGRRPWTRRTPTGSGPGRSWGNYFGTVNAAAKFNEIDRYARWRLKRFLVKRKGRHLKAGEADRWTGEYFGALGLYRLRGTVRYPERAFWEVV